MNILVVVGVILAVFVVIAIIVINRLIHICAPNEVLIFSGSRRQVGTRSVGYRLVQGGRGIRLPLIERVDRMDLTNMMIDVKVTGAYAKGGIPLNVEGVANLKIASAEGVLSNAIERFLGKPRAEIMRVARETLEGNLRGVLATMKPEEVNQDRVKFAQELLEEADKDLNALGLDLDTLKIQNVSDDKGYLDSLGRKQSADLIMRSRIAEAENRALAAERSAENLRTQELARVEAEWSTTQADADRRILDAQTKKSAMVAEERAKVTAAVAKATAELQVQTARLDQVRLQLDADMVKPAEARRQKMIEEARGRAAQVIEDGKATAAALRHIALTWDQQGDSAREIVIAQKLSGLVGQLMDTVSSLPIDKVTVIDQSLLGNGNGDNLAVRAAITNEQLKHTLGVDLGALLKRLGGGDNNGSRPATIPPPIPGR